MQNKGSSVSKQWEKASEEALFAVYDWITDEVCEEKEIEKRIRNQQPVSSTFYPSLTLNKELILTDHQIKSFCINLRLKFLDAQHFNGEIPAPALSKVRQLERETDSKVENFKIIAPAKAFKLTKCEEDPFLLANLGNGRYFLIDSWGPPLPWWRALIYFPLRNSVTLWMSITLLSTFIVWSIPVHKWVGESELNSEIALMAIYVWMGICALYIVGLGVLSLVNGTNDKEWNNPYL